MKIGMFCLHNLGITPILYGIDNSSCGLVLTQLGIVLYFSVVINPAISDF